MSRKKVAVCLKHRNKELIWVRKEHDWVCPECGSRSCTYITQEEPSDEQRKATAQSVVEKGGQDDKDTNRILLRDH